LSDANRSGIGNSDNVWNDAKFMLSANSRKLTAFGICGLFLCLTILSVVSNPQEDAIKLEEKSDVFRTSNSANLNINGSESGSIFSNSVLDIGSSGPVVILNNGTAVEWVNGTPIFSEGEITSTSEPCVILVNYSMYCEGQNNYGQLGIGSTSGTSGYASFNHEPIVIESSSHHSCAILIDASLWCWGRNNHGQVGDGSTTNQVSPIQIDLGTGVDAVAVSAGNEHTCAITGAGDVMCWGYNIRGALGDGTTSDSTSPVLANHSTGERAVALIAPSRSTCVIFENGSVGCWGNKYTVFTDRGTVTANVHIVDLGTSVTATMIDGVGQHTCAVTDDGSMQCWGVNTHGQLGDGTCSSTINQNCSGDNRFPGEGDSTTDVSLSVGLSVIAATTGTDSTCAILSDHSIHCWGAQSGEFDNTSDSKLSPYELIFSDGNNIAFSDQDIDNDGNRNIFDTHQSGDSDGDGVSDSNDDYPNNPARWVECPDGQFGRLQCISTDAGYFSFSGALVQIACLAGTFQPISGQSNCLSTSAGHYTDSDGSPTQLQCPPGYFQSSIGQTSCTPADAGSFVKLNGNDAGDTFSDSISLSLMSANYTAAMDDGVDVSDIFSINLERDLWFSINLTTPVEPFFNFDLELYNSTFDVVDNSSTNESFEEVSSSSNNTNSELYYIKVINRGMNRTSISYSFILNLRNTQTQIQIGSNSTQVDVEHGIESTQCSSGYWQDQTGQSSCNIANSGYYSYGLGSTSQTPCTLGYYQPSPGSSGCITADPGYYVSTLASSTQTPASPGNYVNSSGAFSQQACAAGTYQPLSAQTTCYAANAGHFVSNSGMANQTSCSPGTYQPLSGQSSCLLADMGHHVSTFAATNQTGCTIGNYQPSTGQAYCLDASPGYFVNSNLSISQSPCEVGTYQPQSGQSYCLVSDPGYFVNSSASPNQNPCQPGSYQPYYGESSCVIADPGFFVNTTAAISQIPCNAGTYNPWSGADESTDCLFADMGYYVPFPASTSQFSCTAGTYSATLGQIICDYADTGHYVADDNATSQEPCEIGYWQGQLGQTNCEIADPGYYVDRPASDNQTPCSAGYYNPNSGSTNSFDCIAADPGHSVATPGSGHQTPCQNGTYQPAGGNSECIDAALGYHVPFSGATGQIGCSMGSFQDQLAGTECFEATPGHYVDSHFASSQKACPQGTFNPEYNSNNLADCIDADPGFFVANTGQASQLPCEEGTYQPDSGLSFCWFADSGYYVDELNSTEQTPCPIGTYNQYSGSTSSTSCLTTNLGYYTNSSGSSDQIPCHEGYYQNQAGQSGCKSAQLGYYVDVPASISQTPAPLNYYVDILNAVEATPCPSGMVTTSDSRTSIDECYSDFDGDLIPDFIDKDDDNDGVLDGPDYCDYGLLNWISSVLIDRDGDGCRDADEDDDDDNDGHLDVNDDLPYNKLEWLDTDGDGIGNNEDTDDDGDGVSDAEEIELQLDPLLSDSDGDNFNDSVDEFPLDPDEWKDTDGDGVGDNSDDFPSIKLYQSYGEVVIHLMIVIVIFAVIAFSVKMGFGGRKEKFEADDNTHEVLEIGGVSVPVSDEDADFIDPSFDSAEREIKDNLVESSMVDIHHAEKSVTESEDDAPSSVDEEGVDFDLGALIESSPPPVPKIEAPTDAQINEHGQKVWRDKDGNVWAQNPDGSLLKHNVLTGGWDSYSQ